MSGVNKATILGHLGRDPELRYLQSGQPVCKLNIATSRAWTDAKGTKHEETEWHRVSVWGPMGENCNKYLSKGRQVYVEGRLRTSSYDKDGQKHYTTEIVADSVQFIGGRPEGGQQQGGQSRKPNAPASGQPQEPDFGDPPADLNFGGKPGDDNIPF